MIKRFKYNCQRGGLHSTNQHQDSNPCQRPSQFPKGLSSEHNLRPIFQKLMNNGIVAARVRPQQRDSEAAPLLKPKAILTLKAKVEMIQTKKKIVGVGFEIVFVIFSISLFHQSA